MSRLLRAVGLAILAVSASGQSPQATLPVVTIELPTGLSEEGLRVQANLSGQFGGVQSGFGRVPIVAHSLRVSGSHEGKRADEIHIAVYAPGCELAYFNISLRANPNPVARLTCRPVAMISLNGSIPSEWLNNKTAEITVSYRAWWLWERGDGFPPILRLAAISPKDDGTFHVDIPDWASLKPQSRMDPAFPVGDLEFDLRDTKTSRSLVPANKVMIPELRELRTLLGGVKMQSSYPANVRFIDGDYGF